MNTPNKLKVIGGALALLVAANGLWAVEEPPPPGPKDAKQFEFQHKPGDREMRFHMIDGKDMPKEKVTFLGVETGRVSPTVSAQLGIPERTGLTVLRVIEGSPSEGVLQEHDILTKFNDQVLVNEPQLAVLVRAAKPGDEVTLTLLRAAKETKVRVKLGEHEVPKFATWNMEGFPHDFDLAGMRFEFQDAANEWREHAREWGDQAREWSEKARDMAGRVRGDVEHTLRVLRSDDDEGGDHVFIDDGGPMKRVTRINTNRGNIVLVDDAGRVEIKMKGDGKHVLVKDKDGKVLFEGPVNTPEERAALSPEVAKRLQQVESQVDVDFNLGDDAETKETSIIPEPHAGGVAFEREAAPQPVRTYTL